MFARRSHWEHNPLVWLVLLLLFSAAVRLAIVFVWLDGGMWSIDGGTYLINRDHVLGIEQNTLIHPRPPLAPGYLLVPFTAVLGDDGGLRLISVLASLLTLPATYYAARSVLPPAHSLAAASLAGVHLWLVEGMAAGMIVLLAYSLFAVILRVVVDWSCGRASLWGSVAMAVAIGLMPFVNQSMTGLATVAFAVLIPYAGWLRRKQGHQVLSDRYFVCALFVGLFIALFALPWYLPVAPGGDTVRYGWAEHGLIKLQTLPVVFVLSSLPLAVLVWVGWPLRKSQGMPVLVGATLIFTGLMIFESSDESIANVFWRAKYAAALPACIMLVIIGSRLGLGRISLILGCVLGGIVSAAILALHYGAPGGSPQVVSSDGKDAVEWIAEHAQPKDVIVSTDWSFARFIGPMTDREVITVMPHGFFSTDVLPVAFRSNHELGLCVLGWKDDCGMAEVIASSGAKYAIVDYHHADYLHPEIAPDLYSAWEHTDALPYTKLVWQRGDVYVWELDADLAD